jgi:hypothetical protein
MDKKDIAIAFDKYGTDKGFQHGYNQMYADVINKIPAVTRILEVGVKKGRSIAAWLDLFPNADIVGGDIDLLDSILPETKKATLIEGDSTKASFATAVGTGFDLIIDDGDHGVDVQWGTFLNLKEAWNHAYVIEDVMGTEAAKTLRRRLKSEGYQNIVVYSSKLHNATLETKNGPITFAFYAIVVYPK